MIDFTRNSRLLTESWMKAFGAWNKTLLKYIYGKDVENSLNFIIRGEVEDVRAYANAIMAEKNYLEAYTEFGKEHPMTEKQRIVLEQAVDNFEQRTGITWPFVDEE